MFASLAGNAADRLDQLVHVVDQVLFDAAQHLPPPGKTACRPNTLRRPSSADFLPHGLRQIDLDVTQPLARRRFDAADGGRSVYGRRLFRHRSGPAGKCSLPHQPEAQARSPKPRLRFGLVFDELINIRESAPEKCQRTIVYTILSFTNNEPGSLASVPWLSPPLGPMPIC